MMYELENGKKRRIPDVDLEKIMKGLQVDKEEAVQIWLEDEGDLINEEQETLDKMASKVKIDHDAMSDKVVKKKMNKPAGEKRTRAKKTDDDKATLIKTMMTAAAEVGAPESTIEVVTADKLIAFSYNGKNYTANLTKNTKVKEIKVKEETAQAAKVKKANLNKANIISAFANALQCIGVEDLVIENAEKIIRFTYNEKHFTLDLVEKRA